MISSFRNQLDGQAPSGIQQGVRQLLSRDEDEQRAKITNGCLSHNTRTDIKVFKNDDKQELALGLWTLTSTHTGVVRT